jgi:transcriptional regulator with XRE-family HTH domain
VQTVDAANELSQFLTSRRAKVTPEQAGLPTYGQRRVPGLRREEVASLAGVSIEYYKRLERGNATGASDGVLEALADALRLDDAERAHLFDLARAASPIPPRRRRRPVQQRVRPAVQRILDSIGSPATVINMRGDYLAANQLGRALYAPLFESREQPPNSARFTFLDPAAQEFFVDWEKAAKDLVAALRSQAGRSPYDRALSDLVGELSTAPTRSAPGGPRTTSATTRRAPSGCTTPSSATSSSATRSWSSQLTRDYGWRSSPPNPAAAPTRPSTSWPAGPPRRTSCRASVRPPTTRGARDPHLHFDATTYPPVTEMSTPRCRSSRPSGTPRTATESCERTPHDRFRSVGPVLVAPSGELRSRLSRAERCRRLTVPDP